MFKIYLYFTYSIKLAFQFRPENVATNFHHKARQNSYKSKIEVLGIYKFQLKIHEYTNSNFII